MHQYMFMVHRMNAPASPTFISGSKRKRESGKSPERHDSVSTRPRKRPNVSLTITIPLPEELTGGRHDNEPSSSPISGLSDPDSLFDEITPPTSLDVSETSRCDSLVPATLTAPPIPGLFFDRTLRLPEELTQSVTQYCLDTYFQQKGINQVMLFGRFIPADSPEHAVSTGLPPLLLQLLKELDTMLRPIVPQKTHDLLFPRTPTCARQAIVNLYRPGEGITPHVDLLRRFGDGIIGVSFGSGCVMQFAKADGDEAESYTSAPVEEQKPEKEKETWDVYLPERSVIVLSEDARYKWTHGIGKHTQDFVAIPDAEPQSTSGQWIERGVRLSITFRWLLPGADVVGEESVSP
ncbi:hypothetical protein H0H92_004150 [Tricholoma furcatifolium]|nr:hypothetical protein H0H92_004150 [Tricholoma furcatifolium]